MELINDKINRLAESITRIDNKQSKILFYLPSMPQASGGIGVVYEHVKILTDLGFDAIVLHDNSEYQKPTWLGEAYTSLKHLGLDKNKLNVTPDDMLVIPEGFSNIMEQTKDMPCIRVVLCQSYLYVLGSLLPGMSWAEMDIRNVVVVTPTLQTYLERVFGKEKFDIKVCRPSVSDEIFQPSSKPKKPVIAISSREQNDVLQISKHFYAAYPQYKWVSFKHMSGMDRASFAESLQECCLGVWVDRIAGFGTFPVECAKTNTPFIGLIPDILPEYATDNVGVWTNNVLDIPDLIAAYFKLWFEDNEPVELVEGLADLAIQYTSEAEKVTVKEIYTNYLQTRKFEIQLIIEKLKTEEDGEN